MEKETKKLPLGTLIKTYKGQRTTTTGIKYDTLLLWYRDDQGIKKTIFYDRPEVEYYVLKDKNSPEAVHPPLYIDVDKVQKFTTYSDNLFRDIAVNTGALSFYDRVKVNYGLNSYNMKNLFKSPLLYGADTELQDQYIAKFYREHETDKGYKLHKCYFDIENDIYHYTGFPDPTEAPCPVCLITLIDSKDMKSYTFILRNKSNQGLIDLENDIDNFKEYMKKIEKDTDNLDLDFEFLFYDDELELIQSFFKKVHELDPDFCGGWNIEYDIQTMENRLIRLYNLKKDKEMSAKQMAAYDMSDSKYMIQKTSRGKDTYITPKAYYMEGVGKIGQRVDSFTVLDGINWIDQMLTYASIHISGGKLDSYKLDFVANHELGKEKLPFGPGETIRNQLYVNTKRFVEYNIRDVILLHLIEEETKDIDMVQRLSDITVTRKDKVFKKSIALTNFVNKYAFDQNLIMSTNKNTTYGNESAYYDSQFNESNTVMEYDDNYLDLFNKKDKFGAFVSDPNNNDFVGMEIFKGKPSKFLFELVCDEDFSSLYPSIIRAFNLDANNIIGKFYAIDQDIKDKLKHDYPCSDMFQLSIKDIESDDSDDDDDDSDEIKIQDDKHETQDLCAVLTDSIISQDWSKIGNLFFDLPTTSELIEVLKISK